MKTPRALLVAVAVFASGQLACSDENVRQGYSSTRTVDILQTTVKNQGSVGFCWAYTISAMVESEALKNDLTLDLSEEYLGFYHVYNTIRNILDGTPRGGVSEGVSSIGEALSLIEKYGLVPESVYTLKFDKSGLAERVIEHFVAEFSDNEKLEQYITDKELLYIELGKLFGKRPIKADETFSWKNGVYTPVSFAKEVLKFDSSLYVVEKLNGENFVEKFEFVKTSFMNGYTVPIGMLLYKNSIKEGKFDLKDCKEDGCEVAGGHAMLAVDFVTEGGRPGEMSETEIGEVYKNKLEYIIVKNSWKTALGFKKELVKPVKENGGYYSITKEYLTPNEEIVEKSMDVQVLLRKDQKYIHKVATSETN